MVKTVEELLRGAHEEGERLPPPGRAKGFRHAAKQERAAAGEQAALFD